MRLLKFLTFLALSVQLFAFDDEEEILPLFCEEAAEDVLAENDLIGGVLSPLSGYPALSELDLIARGAHSVILNRILC